MAVLEMQRIGICAMKKDRKKLLELLQQKGVVEIDAQVEEDEVFKKMDTASSRNIFEKNAQVAERALEILQEYVPEKKGMLSSLEGKALVDVQSYDSVIKRQDAIMSKARQLVSLSRQIAENKANIQKRENQIEALEPWKNLDELHGNKANNRVCGNRFGANEHRAALRSSYSGRPRCGRLFCGGSFRRPGSDISLCDLRKKRCTRYGGGTAEYRLCKAIPDRKPLTGRPAGAASGQA